MMNVRIKRGFWRVVALMVVIIVAVIITLAVYKALAPRGNEPVEPVAGVPKDLPATLGRGAYLAVAADCVACHSTTSGKPYAGGRAFHLPFGTIYSTNITPDKETGIGNWSDDAFVDAVRKGVGSHGHLYPAMPYTSYAGLSRQDVLAIKQYLFSLPPEHQPAPANTLSFPFNQRWGMAFWNLAFFREHRFTPQSDKGPVWNRGAYLATALGHCGECHTPRNIGFAMQSRDYLAGTVVQGWKAYNTTGDQAYGLGDWSDAQIKGYLSLGHAEGRSSAVGPMAEVVQYSLQHLSPSDIDALVVYLRSVSPQNNGAPDGKINLDPAATKASNAVLPAADQVSAETADGASRGKHLFEGDCAGCHQWDGAGRQTAYASLKGTHAANDPSGTALVQVMLHGSQLNIGGRVEYMPSFGAVYSDADIAALANYVLDHFGGKQGAVTPAQVAKQRLAN